MRTIKIKPVEITGICRANLTLDDEFQIKGVGLENPRQSRICIHALGHFPPIILQLQRGHHFFAHATCPDCLALQNGENCVLFLLGRADKWDLCQVMSEYRRLCEQYPEPETARQLRIKATQHQKRGEFSEATRRMKSALAELKRLIVFPT